jgi:hypothetical protein
MSAPVAVTNTTADTIPPGAAMEPVGTADANGRLRVRKPTADDSLAVLINSGTPIPAGQAGTGHLPWFGPLAAAVDPSLIDAATGVWAGTGAAVLGTRANSWRLHAGQTGFLVQAEPLGGLVPVQAVPGTAATPSGSGGSGGGSGSGVAVPGRLIGTKVSRVACEGGVLTVYVRDQYQDAAMRVTDGPERFAYTAGCCECSGAAGSGSGRSGSAGSGSGGSGSGGSGSSGSGCADGTVTWQWDGSMWVPVGGGCNDARQATYPPFPGTTVGQLTTTCCATIAVGE